MDAHVPTDLTPFLAMPCRVPSRWNPDANGWVPHGQCVMYRPDGQLLLEITYDHGVSHGPYRDYRSDGTVSVEGNYVAGVQEGEWCYHEGDRCEVIRFVAGPEVVDWDAFFGHKGPWSDPPVERPAGGPSID